MRNFIFQLRSLFTYFSAILFFFIVGTILIIVSFFNRGDVFEFLIKKFSKTLLFIAGIKTEIEGVEKIDPKKQYIVMMNHVNIFDAFLFYSSFPGKARGVEEESHFSWPFYGWVMSRVGMIPINRKSGRKALESLKKAGQLIRERSEFSIAVLPEGTRTLNGKLSKFKKGGFLLAIESGLDILPVIQLGSFAIKRKGRKLIKPGRVKLIFELPISVKGYSRKNINELMNEVRMIFGKYLE